LLELKICGADMLSTRCEFHYGVAIIGLFSKPDNYPFCPSVDLSHLTYLQQLLVIVALIYTNGIDPEYAGGVNLPNALEKVDNVCSNCEALAVWLKRFLKFW
jgi:hypothetical protein